MVLRILKMIFISGFLTALKCTLLVFGRGSAPDPTGGAYSAPPGPLAGLRGPRLLRDRGRKEEGKEEGMGGEGKGGRKRDGRDRPPFANSCDRPWIIRMERTRLFILVIAIGVMHAVSYLSEFYVCSAKRRSTYITR